MNIEWEATVDDLKDSALEGQIELIDGKMVQLPFHTIGEARVVGNVAISLKRYEDRKPRGIGRAFTSTIVYVVDLPHRKTFSPDVSFAITRPKNPMDFIPGAPVFAAEMRTGRLDCRGGHCVCEETCRLFRGGDENCLGCGPMERDREVVFRDKSGRTDRLSPGHDR